MKVAKHLKSNAVVLSGNKQTLGVGHGQTNRVDALKFALKNMKKYFKKRFFVCASDGFFPFTDSINLLNKNGCNVVAQPSGSINDKIVVSFCIKNKISLYFTTNRIFIWLFIAQKKAFATNKHTFVPFQTTNIFLNHMHSLIAVSIPYYSIYYIYASTTNKQYILLIYYSIIQYII